MDTSVIKDKHSYANDPEFLAELLALQVTNQITLIMDKQELSLREMADRVGVSSAYLSRVLSGNPNMTVKTIAKFAVALGLHAAIRFEELVRAVDTRFDYKSSSKQEISIEIPDDHESPEFSYGRGLELAA
ncbi:MAG: helix-turn-helix domain-containing protein [Chloroflexi bacterium]|nr:helix-turn-helix domain-containing protein [Chloroflexota bacterium]